MSTWWFLGYVIAFFCGTVAAGLLRKQRASEPFTMGGPERFELHRTKVFLTEDDGETLAVLEMRTRGESVGRFLLTERDSYELSDALHRLTARLKTAKLEAENLYELRQRTKAGEAHDGTEN